MQKYYISTNNTVYGPYSAREMVDLHLLNDTLVTVEGSENWTTADHFNFEAIARNELDESLRATGRTVGYIQTPPTPQAQPQQQSQPYPQPPAYTASQSAPQAQPQQDQQYPQPPAYTAPQPQHDVAGTNAHTYFPAIEIKANFNEGINSIGGKILILPDRFVFKAHSLNVGNVSDRTFLIRDITGYKKGILTFLYVYFNNGQRIKLTIGSKQKFIDALEQRRQALFSTQGLQMPQAFNI